MDLRKMADSVAQQHDGLSGGVEFGGGVLCGVMSSVGGERSFGRGGRGSNEFDMHGGGIT